MLALIVAASTFHCSVNIASGAEFTLTDGRSIEGEILHASDSAVIIWVHTGELTQLNRGTVNRVELLTDTHGVVAGRLESWTEGVYEIETEDKFIKVKGSRIVAERRKVPAARKRYKFGNMLHGEYCRNAYTQVSKADVSGPVAMALGEESCGLGGAGNETIAEAEAEALKRCKSATTGCRIIFSKGAD